MKYKLGDKLNAFLTDNVLPKHKGGIEKNILDSFGESDILMAKTFQIEAHKTVYGIEFYIAVGRSDLEEFEPLKPNVWYPREKFDRNPNDYVLIELDEDGEWNLYEPLACNNFLSDSTTKFMYIDKPNK